MRILIQIILVVTLMIVCFGCDPSNKPAKGFEDEIFVVADSIEYLEIKSALNSTFERIINTPQPEKRHTVCLNSADTNAESK